MLAIVLALTISGVVDSPDPITVQVPTEEITVKSGTTFHSDKEIYLEGKTITFEGEGDFKGSKVHVQAHDGMVFKDGWSRIYYSGNQWSYFSTMGGVNFASNVTISGSKGGLCSLLYNCFFAKDEEEAPPETIISENVKDCLEWDDPEES